VKRDLWAYLLSLSSRGQKPIVITCIFGKNFWTLHPSPIGFRSIFFTNNPDLEGEAFAKGWEFKLVLLQEMSLSDDEIISSIQSKYVKFLMFANEFPDVITGQPILYIDHKVEINAGHIKFLQQITQTDKAILMRNTPRLKSTISDEVEDALPYDRYSKSMPKTLEWVERMKKERGVIENVRIMNTGLILYSKIAPLRGVLDEVYEVVKELKQPECQIIWAVLSQPIHNLIQRVEWSDIGIEHKLP
jgi:hypothetical protein